MDDPERTARIDTHSVCEGWTLTVVQVNDINNVFARK